MNITELSCFIGGNMDTYIINGGKCLEGEIKVQGSKNASLPIIAATVLNGKYNIIKNCPNITDVVTMQKILTLLGCKVKYHDNILEVDSSTFSNDEIEEELMKEMRSSVILMGAILGRNKRVILTHPGGCEIGARPIDLHLKGLKKLGINIIEKHGLIICEATELIGADVNLDFPSVGATENIMLAAVKAKGRTVIRNVAREPEIIELQKFLNSMGAKIKGAGSSIIRIDGVDELNGSEYEVEPDRIVAGTYLCAGAITGGNLLLKDVKIEEISPIIYKLKETGCKIKSINNKDIEIFAPKKLKPIDTIKTLPYPGFPTDMQSQFTAMLSVADGTSVVTENIFENRYKYVSELYKMGANITIEGRTAIIKGVQNLMGAEVIAKDLRGGAALVLAGLKAEGYTNISQINFIERGYEDFVENLKRVGADIRIKS